MAKVRSATVPQSSSPGQLEEWPGCLGGRFPRTNLAQGRSTPTSSRTSHGTRTRSSPFKLTEREQPDELRSPRGWRRARRAGRWPLIESRSLRRPFLTSDLEITTRVLIARPCTAGLQHRRRVAGSPPEHARRRVPSAENRLVGSRMAYPGVRLMPVAARA